jgi:hypothetical protein
MRLGLKQGKDAMAEGAWRRRMAVAQQMRSAPAGVGPTKSLMGSSDRQDVALCVLLFLVLCGRRMLLQHLRSHGPEFADDAFYYFVAARHVVQNHMSSFDGFTLTNGYHPLWLGLVALQYKVLGQSLVLTRVMEHMLGLVALLTTLPMVRLPGTAAKLVYTWGLFVVLSVIGFNGMETAAFAGCLGLLCYASVSLREESRHPVLGALVLGAAATAAIAARIDAAVFVLPQVWLAAATKRRRLIAIAVVAVSGALYAGLDRNIFGVPFPISGEVKSLGGLQVNHRLLAQMASPWGATSRLFWVSAMLFALTPLAMRVMRERGVANRALQGLQMAFLMGLPIYLLRLVALSSWMVWSWYGYCLLFGYIGCAPAAWTLLSERLERVVTQRYVLVTVSSLMVTYLAVTTGYAARHHAHDMEPGYYAVNQQALEQYGGLLGTSRVAMGDRAGNFAYQYAGGVNQMEGIMNDKAFFDVLRERGDVKALLCKRQVRYVIAYEDDLGNYDRHAVATIRPKLSQFVAPTVDVRRQDEIAKVFDLSKLGPGANGLSDTYLYIWKLPCS